MRKHLLFVLLTLTFGLVGCSKDEDVDTIIGTWEAVSETAKEMVDGKMVETTQPYTDTEKFTFTFIKDQTAKLWSYIPETKRWVTSHLTYEITGNKITLTATNGGGEEHLEFTYVLNGNELILTLRQDGNESFITLNRK